MPQGGSTMFCIASSTEIRQRVNELALEVTKDFIKEPPSVLWIANGSMYFAADLTRAIDFPLPCVECIKARSYEGILQGPVRVNIKALKDKFVRDKNILLVDDILDTGTTLNFVVGLLNDRGARNIEICVLLIKEGTQKYPITPTYCGFAVDNDWVVGYGLDWKGAYRNQPYIGVPKEKVPFGRALRRARPWNPSSVAAT
jgi:hypoxanthine phosphoribosyltransferase